MPSINDDFADAIEVVIATAGGTYTSASLDTTGNTTESGEPVISASASVSAWWKYTPTSSGSATFDTQLTTPTYGSTDTYMAIWTGTNFGDMVNAATDDDSGGSGTSLISGLSVTSGTTYWIQIGGFGGVEVNLVLRVTGPETTGGGTDGTATPGVIAATIALPAATALGGNVQYVSQGAAVAGTTSITTAEYGTGWADGDLGVCTIASNHATTEATEPTMPAGWDKVGTLNGGGGAQGAGTGNRRLTFFERVLATGDDTTPTISLSTGNVMIAAITVYKKPAGYTWAASVAAFGAETTAGTSWSQVMTSDPGFDALDMLHAACAVRDTSTSSAEGFSATGATFSTLAERIDSTSETGNDISLHVQTADVLTGPSSAAGTSTATHSTSETGVMGVLRIRATASSGDGTATPAVAALTTTLPATTESGGGAATPAALAATLAAPAPTAKAGGDATPAAITAPVLLPASTESGGGTATPAATSAALALPAPTGSGSGTTAPAVAALTTALPAATGSGGGRATPAVVAVTVTLPAANPSGSSGGTATPAAITVPVTLPAPTASGAGTATPSVIATNVTLPAAALSAGGTGSPAVIPVTITLPAPAASGGGSGTAAPAVIACTATLPAATESGGGTGTPATLPLALTFPAAAAQGHASTSPTVIPLTITTPAATGSGGTSGTATPGTLALVTSVPNPGTGAGATVNPATIALAITLATAIASNPGADPNPVTVTIRDSHHTVTVRTTGTTTTVREQHTTATLPDTGATGITVRERGHTTTVREQG